MMVILPCTRGSRIKERPVISATLSITARISASRKFTVSFSAWAGGAMTAPASNRPSTRPGNRGAARERMSVLRRFAIIRGYSTFARGADLPSAPVQPGRDLGRVDRNLLFAAIPQHPHPVLAGAGGEGGEGIAVRQQVRQGAVVHRHHQVAGGESPGGG